MVYEDLGPFETKEDALVASSNYLRKYPAQGYDTITRKPYMSLRDNKWYAIVSRGNNCD